METYYWETELEHPNNEVTMEDYLNGHLPDDCELLSNDGTYAEILTSDNKKYAVHASGNGDFRSHKVQFELID